MLLNTDKWSSQIEHVYDELRLYDQIEYSSTIKQENEDDIIDNIKEDVLFTDPIYKLSPFYIDFLVFSEASLESLDSYENNLFFNPGMAKCFHKKFVSYLCFWSLNEIEKQRFSNEVVENF